MILLCSEFDVWSTEQGPELSIKYESKFYW